MVRLLVTIVQAIRTENSCRLFNRVVRLLVTVSPFDGCLVRSYVLLAVRFLMVLQVCLLVTTTPLFDGCRCHGMLFILNP